MTEKQPSPLAKEMETFRRLFENPGEHEGKFAVIHGDTLLGTFADYGDALGMGYRSFGLEPFLVKRISSVPDIAHYSRRLVFA